MKKNEENSTTAKDKNKADNPNELVMVSFRLEKKLKDAITEDAKRHGRPISQQFAQSLKDGQALQGLIKEISEVLSDEIEIDGKVFTYKPDEEECMSFIHMSAMQMIEKARKEKEASKAKTKDMIG